MEPAIQPILAKFPNIIRWFSNSDMDSSVVQAIVLEWILWMVGVALLVLLLFWCAKWWAKNKVAKTPKDRTWGRVRAIAWILFGLFPILGSVLLAWLAFKSGNVICARGVWWGFLEASAVYLIVCTFGFHFPLRANRWARDLW